VSARGAGVAHAPPHADACEGVPTSHLRAGGLVDLPNARVDDLSAHCAARSPTWSCIGKTVRVAGGAGSGFCSGRGLAIQTTPAHEKRISFAQPCGLTKGYFCPHLVHQTACSLRRPGLSRASRR